MKTTHNGIEIKVLELGHSYPNQKQLLLDGVHLTRQDLENLLSLLDVEEGVG